MLARHSDLGPSPAHAVLSYAKGLGSHKAKPRSAAAIGFEATGSVAVGGPPGGAPGATVREHGAEQVRYIAMMLATCFIYCSVRRRKKKRPQQKPSPVGIRGGVQSLVLADEQLRSLDLPSW